jgi:16S rRNA (guanine(966)-N(2))-methyltransferase RsmD
MRIIGGRVKSRRLLGPKGLAIRPTSDKVREALFDILGERIAGANFLDLYAGTGSVAIEALSRGAASAVLVEQNPRAIQLIKDNLTRCGLRKQARVIPSSVSRALPRLAAGAGFDIIFVDPPYRSRLVQETLSGLVEHDMLQPHTLVIVEHRHQNESSPRVGKLRRYRESKYGQTSLSFYQLI